MEGLSTISFWTSYYKYLFWARLYSNFSEDCNLKWVDNYSHHCSVLSNFVSRYLTDLDICTKREWTRLGRYIYRKSRECEKKPGSAPLPQLWIRRFGTPPTVGDRHVRHPLGFRFSAPHGFSWIPYNSPTFLSRVHFYCIFGSLRSRRARTYPFYISIVFRERRRSHLGTPWFFRSPLGTPPTVVNPELRHPSHNLTRAASKSPVFSDIRVTFY